MDREKERQAGRAMGIGSSLLGILFVIIWCAMAAAMGAWFMLLFGIPFLGFMIYRLVVCIRLTQKEKPVEPWEQKDRHLSAVTPREDGGSSDASATGYCPYCAQTVREEYTFCPKCGRRIR